MKRGHFIMNIGEKIRKARKEKGMTQEELGELLGIKKSAVAKYENGRVQNIKRSTLKRISAILDIPPSELIFEKPRTTAETFAGLSEKEIELFMALRELPPDEYEKKMEEIIFFIDNNNE
jgi:transcriptional regulator with XRE-family HTH domain